VNGITKIAAAPLGALLLLVGCQNQQERTVARIRQELRGLQSRLILARTEAQEAQAVADLIAWLGRDQGIVFNVTITARDPTTGRYRRPDEWVIPPGTGPVEVDVFLYQLEARPSGSEARQKSLSMASFPIRHDRNLRTLHDIGA
jgi:hypothetical protein